MPISSAPANRGEKSFTSDPYVLTTTAAVFEGMPTARSQLPLTFDNGFEFESMVGFCQKCDENIKGDNLRGLFEKTRDGYLFAGLGMCQCGTMSRFRLSLVPNVKQVRITQSSCNGPGQVGQESMMVARVMVTGAGADELVIVSREEVKDTVRKATYLVAGWLLPRRGVARGRGTRRRTVVVQGALERRSS